MGADGFGVLLQVVCCLEKHTVGRKSPMNAAPGLQPKIDKAIRGKSKTSKALERREPKMSNAIETIAKMIWLPMCSQLDGVLPSVRRVQHLSYGQRRAWCHVAGGLGVLCILVQGENV